MQPTFILLDGPEQGRSLSFPKKRVTVGRHKTNDIVLDYDENLRASNKHAEVIVDDGQVILRDLGSSNGTYVNGDEIREATLNSGDSIEFGYGGAKVEVKLPGVKFEEAPPKKSPEKKAPAGPAKKGPAKKAPVRKSPSKKPAQPSPQRPGSRRSEKPARSAGGKRSRKEEKPIGTLTMVRGMVMQNMREASHKVRLTIAVSAGILILVVVVFMVMLKQQKEEGDRKIQEQQQALDEKQQQLARVYQALTGKGGAALRHLAEEDRKMLSESEARRRQARGKTTKEIAELQRKIKAGGGDAGTIAALKKQIDALKLEIRQNKPIETRFKEIERKYAGSIYLVYAQVTLRKKSTKEERAIAGFGTGFMVTADGHLVTNKHVIQPWKFREMAMMIAYHGLEIVPNSHLIAVWPNGEAALLDSEPRLDRGFNNGQSSNLRVFAVAADKWVETEIASPDGKGALKVRFHSPTSNNDLAVLQLQGQFKPIPLAREAKAEKLDPVMILGFPQGSTILEKGVAETSPSLGTIRKIQETIMVTAPIIGGNSGGPAVNLSGQVIGVATRGIRGTETLGTCLKIRHAIDLLPAAYRRNFAKEKR